MTRDEWYAKLPTATQEEKDQALFMMAEALKYDEVRALLKAGAQVNGGQDMFGYLLRRSNDIQMANLMLDEGMKPNTIRHRDLMCFYDEDKDEAYRTLGRIINAGMPEEERVKAAASALKKGDFVHLDAYILKPGENVCLLLNWADFGRETVAWDREDTRDITQDDVDKYIAWHHSIEELHKEHFKGGVDSQKLAATVTKEGMTGLMLATRTNNFDAVLDFYRQHPQQSPDPAQLTQEDRYGQSVVSLLAHRQQLQSLFEPALWKDKPEDALILLSDTAGRYDDQLDQVKIAREMATLRLKKPAQAKVAAPLAAPASKA